MAHLTDAEHKTVGHTVLYIPDEGATMSDPDSHKNKEFLQRMEGIFLSFTYSLTHPLTHPLSLSLPLPPSPSLTPLVIVIHWTRQIKELLSSQESLEATDSSGPLQEIEFWRARCEDLSGTYMYCAYKIINNYMCTCTVTIIHVICML